MSSQAKKSVEVEDCEFQPLWYIIYVMTKFQNWLRLINVLGYSKLLTKKVIEQLYSV